MGNLITTNYRPGDIIRVVSRLDDILGPTDVPYGYQVHFMPIGTVLAVREMRSGNQDVYCDIYPPVMGIDGTTWDGQYLSVCDIELVSRG